MPIELGYLSKLCPGNYILYGPAGYLFHRLSMLAGYSGLAVHSLQRMDALLGAAGLGIFFLTLRRLGAERRDAFLWAGILGVSLGYWSWSAEAQSYILGALVLAVNLYFLVRYAQGEGSPLVLGALAALAVACHIVHAVFLPVGLWFINVRHGRAWRRPALLYAASAGGLALAAYGAVMGLLVRPRDALGAWHWFLGSADSREGGVWWHGGSGWAGLASWLKMTLNVFTSFSPAFPHAGAGVPAEAALWLARLLLAAFAWAALSRPKGLRGEKRAVAIGCGIWLAAYAAVFTSWEPFTMVYRVSDLLPLCLLLFLGYERLLARGRAWRWAALALFLALGAGNFAAEIYPRSLESNNPALARMAFLRERTGEGDWVAGEGGRDELYIPFFARRRPLIVGIFRADPAALVRRIDAALQAGQGVFVTSSILEDGYWKGFFARFAPRESARDSDGFVLYRLTRPFLLPSR